MSTSIWNRLFESAGEGLQWGLWQAVINTVAESVLATQGIKPENDYELDEDYDCELHGLIGDWMRESLPRDHTLIELLDGPEVFEGNGTAWEEEICLTGDACPCIDDIYESLSLRSECRHAFYGGITKEMLEDFYRDWRACFLSRVADEARLVSNSSG
ncbi:hypothetical protein [Novipirellula rosea]|uniref:DUF4240 domain-containing protein n=1 Tax=Novipirellula rosea TaxID=1031540 RepID=A0ABP8MUV7_9BACT